MSAEAAGTASGRIPFRIRLGVTGHRTDLDAPDLVAEVRRQVSRVNDLIRTPDTPVHLAVVSLLADGADRLVVDQVFAEATARDEPARLEALLPMESAEYARAQDFGVDSREELERLLSIATVRTEPSGGSIGHPGASGAAAYEAAGRQLVARCDVLLALWDGEPPRGRGGTAETLLYAAARAKPCIWISTHGAIAVRDNLSPGTAGSFHREVAKRMGRTVEPIEGDGDGGVLGSLRASFLALDEFNREELSTTEGRRLREELDSEMGSSDWVWAPFLRATTLAARWQWRFKWGSRSIALLATAAAAMLAIGLSFGHQAPAWAWAEAFLFLLAMLGVAAVRGAGTRRRWLSYRVLAERLRSAYFLAPTGVDFRRQARLEGVYVGSQPTDWLVRAFEEVWDGRPRDTKGLEEMSPSELGALKEWLARDWLGRQIAYHENAAHRHRRWHRALARPVVALFGATIVFACLHALHLFEDVSIFFSVALPAAGASLGLLLTVNQHHALAERYARMRSDLMVAHGNLLDAGADTLGRASSEAARAIAQETGAWFGSMWFLDVEHP